QDIWLNEGFASYAQWAWREHIGNATTTRTLEKTFLSYPKPDPFWNLTIGDPGKNQLFNWQVYSRGAMTLAALRERVGDVDFDSIMRTWITDNQNSDASVEDFIGLAETLSGENLDGFFDAWLYTSARPAKTTANGLNF
ncbi:MAG: M1 family aminopeptidase, partial [Candidatus Nanopelagicales bacterium]